MKGMRPRRLLLHPRLCWGRELTLARSGLPWVSRSGNWDRSDALHCVAMALALLGRLSDPTHVSTSMRSAETRFWNRAWPHYLHGLKRSELASFIWELNLGVQPVPFEGSAIELMRACARELGRGWPSLLCWRFRKDTRLRTSLVLGVEAGADRRAAPEALLLLDPEQPIHPFGFGNARLVGAKADRAHCLTSRGHAVIVLEGGVSIRLLASSR